MLEKEIFEGWSTNFTTNIERSGGADGLVNARVKKIKFGMCDNLAFGTSPKNRDTNTKHQIFENGEIIFDDFAIYPDFTGDIGGIDETTDRKTGDLEEFGEGGQIASQAFLDNFFLEIGTDVGLETRGGICILVNGGE